MLLAQSYMPAQSPHILKNLNNPELSPWFKVPQRGSYTLQNGLLMPQIYTVLEVKICSEHEFDQRNNRCFRWVQQHSDSICS